MIDAADFKKWLEIFGIKQGGTPSAPQDLETTYLTGVNAQVTLEDGRPVIFETTTSASNANSITTPSTGTNTVANFRVLGWTFTPSGNMQCNALQYDDALFTQPGTRETGIYVKSTMELVATVFIAKTDPLDSTNTFRTKTLDTPVILYNTVEYVFATVVPASEANHINNNAVPSNMTITQYWTGPTGLSLIPLSFPQNSTNASNTVFVGSFVYDLLTIDETININDSTTDTSTIFEIRTTTRASIPIPPMSAAQRDAIGVTNFGSWVYVNNESPRRPYVYDGTTWQGVAYTSEVSAVSLQSAYNDGNGTITINNTLNTKPFAVGNDQNTLFPGYGVYVSAIRNIAASPTQSWFQFFEANNSSASFAQYGAISCAVSSNTAGSECGTFSIGAAVLGQVQPFVSCDGLNQELGIFYPTIITDGGGPRDASAILDVFSTTKGSRAFPSMTTTQRNAISSPATGLTVFNTTTKTIDYYDGSAWQIGLTIDKLIAGTNITLTQNGDGTVTVSASGSGPGGNADYAGSSFSGNATSTTFASANVYYPITINSGTFVDIVSSNFVNEVVTISGHATPCLRYIDSASQYFQFNFNLFAKGAVAAQKQYVFQISIQKADTSIVQTGFVGTVVLQDLIFPYSIPLSGVAQLNTGDRVFVSVQNITDTSSVTVVYGNADIVNVDATQQIAMVWNNVTTTSASMVSQNGYVANNAGTVTLTLPTTCNFGAEIKIDGFGAGGFVIAQNTGQQCFYQGASTTLGATGTISSTNSQACLTLRCVVANTTYLVESTTGEITLA